MAGLFMAGGPAWAQGFGVYEQGACAMGRGGAAVAAPCPDGSTVFFNPAGIAFEPETRVGLGSVLIAPRGTFTNDKSGLVTTLNKKVYPVPTIYFSKKLGDRFSAGLGLNAPYGLTTDWPVNSEGRFLGYKSVVQGVYLQPTVGIKLNEKVALGIGVDIVYVNVELRQRVDLAVQKLSGTPYTFQQIGVPAGTDFADVQLKGHTVTAGVHVGLLAKPSDKFSIGVRFLSGQTAEIDNGKLTTAQVNTGLKTAIPLPGIPAGTPYDAILTSQFGDGATLESGQKGTTRLPLPAQFVGGIAFKATPKLSLMVDYRWTQWSKFDELVINKENSTSPTVTVEAYKDANAVHAGMEYEVSPKLVVRGGWFTNTAAAPDQSVTPNLPEGKRQNYSAGIGFQLSPTLRIDAAYMRLQQGDRKGRTTDGGLAVPTTAVNNGVYKFNANLFGLSLGLRF